MKQYRNPKPGCGQVIVLAVLTLLGAFGLLMAVRSDLFQ